LVFGSLKTEYRGVDLESVAFLDALLLFFAIGETDESLMMSLSISNEAVEIWDYF
jgi:hypothetical protein